MTLVIIPLRVMQGLHHYDFVSVASDNSGFHSGFFDGIPNLDYDEKVGWKKYQRYWNDKAQKLCWAKRGLT